MTNPTASWPPIQANYNVHGYTWKSEALEIRLRDTAAALRPFVDLLQHHNDRADRDDSTPVFAIDRAIITLGDLRKGRAILARLEQEGLT